MNLLFWRRPRIPVLVLHGILARRGALNIAAYGPVIEQAFAAAARKRHLVLDIDSPGGSPVQSDLIASRIRRLAGEKGVTVHAVIGEVGASGGYWLACAADRVLANPMSIVGSIGVVSGGFGLDAALGRLGVRRRLYTAGENKGRGDPFLPERPQDVAFTQTLLDELHGRFKDWVQARRAGRLKGDETSLFDGSYMLGSTALRLGLVDGFGDVATLVRELGGETARPAVFRPRRRGLLARLPRAMADATAEALAEQRAPRLGM
jgi:ClpP class serine protease